MIFRDKKIVLREKKRRKSETGISLFMNFLLDEFILN